MGRLSRFSPQILACLLVAGLMAACGNKNNTTTITSTVMPTVFYSHVVAMQDSTLYVWGANNLGQQGNGDQSGFSIFVPTARMTQVLGASAGGTHTLALKTDHSVWAWGNNGYGQLGNGSLNISLIPVPVYNQYSTTKAHPLVNVAAVAAGGNHSLALDQSGEIWAWGGNYNGQLGDGTIATRTVANKVIDAVSGAPLQGATKIAAGGSHSLAIVIDGTGATARAWGYNGFGQLGQSKTFGTYSASRDSYYPLRVVKAADGNILTNVTDIAAGGSHSLFIVNDGVNPARIWACGYNGLGQLGLGNTADQHDGAVLVGSASFYNTAFPVQVAAGLDHSLALMSDGTVWAWGYNFSGQLGNGATLSTVGSEKLSPIQVQTDAKPTYLTNIVKILAIGSSSYAVDSSGNLWAWGDNTFGQLGLGSSTSQAYATKVGSGFSLYHP